MAGAMAMHLYCATNEVSLNFAARLSGRMVPGRVPDERWKGRTDLPFQESPPVSVPLRSDHQ